LLLRRGWLLIAESIHSTTVRALPGNVVAGHAPDIFLHAGLADLKTAAAAPAKWMNPVAAMALLFRRAPPAPSAITFCTVVHIK
jgi:hypothetical protein